MFVQIGDVLPRFHVYERLFGRHELVVEALSDVYVDIINFCIDVKAIFRQDWRSLAINLKVFSKLTWKPFERQFGERMSGFRQHAKNVEKSAGLSHMIEAADARETTREQQMQLQKMHDEDRCQRVLACLTSVDHDSKQRRLRRDRCEGTCDWFLRRTEYLQWKKATCSSILSISGIPGSGKSVLVSHIVDEYRRTTRDAFLNLVFYYFDYTDQRSLQLSQILGSWIRQLMHLGLLSSRLETLVSDACHNGMRAPDDIQLEELLSYSLKEINTLVFVLDGKPP